MGKPDFEYIIHYCSGFTDKYGTRVPKHTFANPPEAEKAMQLYFQTSRLIAKNESSDFELLLQRINAWLNLGVIIFDTEETDSRKIESRLQTANYKLFSDSHGLCPKCAHAAFSPTQE